MKQPQYVFRPNLNDPQQRQAWAILEQIPSGQRKAFLVQAILATEQDDRLEKIIRKVMQEELRQIDLTDLPREQPTEPVPVAALDFLSSL
ncbi:plasmid segregation centromere-binding protein ParR [Gemmiger sp.]|uniref:plasmid segregation centromere-binding protein ParR n=1 Tax=Gemmiger sp. TaxID=2049027 RepID=UPI003AF9EDC5